MAQNPNFEFDDPDELLDKGLPSLVPTQLAPVQAPEPVAPIKVGEGTGSYIKTPEASPKMYSRSVSEDQVKDWLRQRDALTGQVTTEGGGEKASRLISAAPEWYKGGAPPKGHQMWSDVMNTLGSAAAAPAAQRLKDPNRLASAKQGDARKVALAGGMSTLFSNLFNQGKQNYDTQQAAALKEAQMMKTLPGGKTASQLKLDAINKQLQFAHDEASLDSLQGQRNFNQGQVTALHDPNDPEAVTQRGILKTEFGIDLPPTTSREIVNKTLAMLRAKKEAEYKGGQSEADAINKERQARIEADIKAQANLTENVIKAEQKRNESAVPGMVWNNNTPPGETETIKDARQLYRDSQGFMNTLNRMRALQPVIEKAAREYARKNGFGDNIGGALAAMGPITRWTNLLGPEAQAAANEAVILQTSIGNYFRGPNYSNLGVPQKWEELKTNTMIPLAGDPSAWLRGEQMWKALHDDVQRRWVEGVHAFGAHLPDEPEPGLPAGAKTPEMQQAERPSAPAQPRARFTPNKGVETVSAGSGAGETTDTPTDENGQPVTENDPNYARQVAEDEAKNRALEAGRNAPKPAPAQAAPGTKKIRVTIKGGATEERNWPQERIDAFAKKHKGDTDSGAMTIEVF